MGTEQDLHCKGIRLNTCLDLRPGSTGGDWKAFAGTGRIRADRRRTTAVAQVVEENVPASVRLGRQDVALHVEFLEGADEPARVAVRLIMRPRRVEVRHDVNTLAARKFGPGGKPFAFHEITELQRCLD